MLGNDVLHQHLAAGCCHSRHIGACFNLVGNDGIGAAAQPLNTPDLNDIGTGAGHIGAHGIEEVCQIYNMGFFGSVFDDGGALCQNGGNHNVHGCAHGNNIQIDAAAMELCLGGRNDIAADDLYVSAHDVKALDVLVDGTDAEIAAAGHGNRCLAEPTQQCAHQIIGRTDLTGKLMGHGAGVDAGAVQFKGGPVNHPNRSAHPGQNIEIKLNIRHIRDVLDSANTVYQQSRRKNCHRCIFCAADLYFTVQRISAVYHILCHNAPSQSLLIYLTFYSMPH